MEREFRRLWPRVDPNRLISLLREHEEALPDLEATIARAFSYPAEQAGDAASLLMAPVGAALPLVTARDRHTVMQALDILVRGGGDPSPVSALLARALSDAKMQTSAVKMLRFAALRGWSLLPIEEPLAGVDLGRGRDSPRSLQRLLRMQQAGHSAAIAQLSAAYAAQRPIGDLLEGTGLVEELFLTGAQEDVDLANATLAGLKRAGKDAFAIWSALVPALRRHLRVDDPALRQQAACALGQIKYSVSRSAEFDEEETAREAVRLLEDLLSELADLLGLEGGARVAAANTLKTCAELGCSMAAIEGSLVRAMEDPQVAVRSACSEALSIHLARTKREAALPRGFSHRRTHARSDTPLRSRRSPTICERCGESAVDLIYEWNDGAQFYSRSIFEERCSACGVYRVEDYSAPG